MRKPTVLIVDDEVDIRNSIVEYIKQDFDSLEAENGSEALQLLKNNKVDVVLTDYNMSDLDGLELIKTMHESAMGIPVIVMTGRGSQEVHVQAFAYNIFEYIEKPFDLRELRHSLKKSLVYQQDNAQLSGSKNFASKMNFEDLHLKLSKDVVAELREQCQIHGLSISAYIERLIRARASNKKDLV